MAPKARKIYYLLFYWQIYYLLTPALESILSTGLSVRFNGLNFPNKKRLAIICYCMSFLVSWGPRLQRQVQSSIPCPLSILLCPSAACTALCSAHAALFGSPPASETQCTRDFHLSSHMGTTSNFLKYHRKKKLYMEICVECVTMISISYKESISTAQPCLNNQLCINHRMTCGIIKLHHNSECFIWYRLSLANKSHLWHIFHIDTANTAVFDTVCTS